MPKLELTKHRGSGQWRKRIAGVDHYFGPFRSVPYREAVAKMRRLQLDIADGKATGAGPKLRVSTLCQRWYRSKAEDVTLGIIAETTLSNYRLTSQFIESILGKRSVGSLKAEDFREMQLQAADRWGYYKQCDMVTQTRMIFSWGFDQGLHDPVRIPRSFRKPRRPVEPREGPAKASLGSRWVWTREEYGQALRMDPSASKWFHGVLLMGLNTGYGNSDISDLQWEDIYEVEGQMVVARPRRKTGRQRMAPLWPETLDALGPRATGRVFVTRTGLPLVGGAGRNTLSQGFRRRTGKPFYGLRHMFQTIGSQIGDSEAVRYMMGHAPKDMADHYTLAPAWTMPRLIKVTDHIRKWVEESK